LVDVRSENVVGNDCRVAGVGRGETGSAVAAEGIPSQCGNGVAERFMRTARSECFGRVLILNRPHLDRIVAVFSDH